MITFTHHELGIDFSMEENDLSTLIIENPLDFRSLVSELISMEIGNDSEDIILLKDYIPINFNKKVEFITDPLNIDINSNKKLNKYLYDSMIDEINMLPVELNNLNKTAIDLLDIAASNSGMDSVEYSLELNVKKFLKLYSLSFSDDFDSYLQLLVEYIRLLSSLCGIELFIFINLKAYLSKDELKQLKEMSNLYKTNILLIEFDNNTNNDFETIHILDFDSYFIVK